MKILGQKICFLLLLISSTFLNGQATVSQVNGSPFKVDKYNDVEGTPYLYESWVPATIYGYNDEKLENLSVNYNTHTGSFEYKQDNYTLIKLNSMEYNRVEVFNRSSRDVYKNFPKLGDDQYLKLIVENKGYSVFRKEYSKIKEEELGFYNSGSSRSKFVRKIQYFILKDNELIEFKPKAKEISKILNNREVKKIIKSNKLKIKKEEDLVKLFLLLS